MRAAYWLGLNLFAFGVGTVLDTIGLHGWLWWLASLSLLSGLTLMLWAVRERSRS